MNHAGRYEECVPKYLEALERFDSVQRQFEFAFLSFSKLVSLEVSVQLPSISPICGKNRVSV